MTTSRIKVSRRMPTNCGTQMPLRRGIPGCETGALGWTQASSPAPNRRPRQPHSAADAGCGFSARGRVASARPWLRTRLGQHRLDVKELASGQADQAVIVDHQLRGNPSLNRALGHLHPAAPAYGAAVQVKAYQLP